MSSQPIEANVVLTTDNSQYDQAMNASSGVTQNLSSNVDTLGSKISKLTKTAGKSLIGISAADVALITGATAAWSSYEKQMSRLSAQSAVLGRTNNEQNRLMKDYTNTVKGLRSEYGMTTTAAASLVQTLSKITDLRQSRDLKDLSKVFVDMSHATGESSEGLASSLTNLQKLMGTPVNSKTTRQYADQFTHLAASTNTSAQSLIEFTSAIAPAGRQIGITSKEMAGFATAFTRAGQDSGPAANVFTKITTDIAHSMQTGSPEIAHYANLLGVTQKAFKQMSGGEQVIEILEALQQKSGGAASELQRMGLEGPRSIKAIQGILQGGGLRQAMGLSASSYGDDSAAKGAKASTAGLSDEMARLRQETEQLAETFGQMFGPTIEKFVGGMVKAMKVVDDIASGPIGKMIGAIMAIVAPFAAGAGAILLFAGALLKLAGIFTLFRNSMSYGAREGFKGGAALGGLGADGSYMARGERELAEHGKQLAGITSDRPGTYGQRGLYNAGVYGGRFLRGAPGTITGGLVDATRWARGKMDPNYTPPTGPGRSAGSYVAGGLSRAIDYTVTPLFDQMRYDDPTKREASRMLGQVAPWTKAGDRIKLAGQLADEHLAKYQMGSVEKEVGRVSADPLLTNQARAVKLEELRTIKEETKVRLDTATQTKTATLEQIESYRGLNKEVGENAQGFSRLKESVRGAGMAAGGGVLGGLKAGGKAFLNSGMAAPVAGMAGMAAVSATGSDSKMLMLGAAGMGLGPEGAIAGALIGGTLDMIQSNNKMKDSIAGLTDQTNAAVKSGGGLSNWYDTMAATQKGLDETAKSRAIGSKSFWMGSPTTALGSIWNWGNRNVDGGPQAQDQKAIDEERARGLQVEGTARDLAKRTGTRIFGSKAAQRKQLDEFMAGIGAQRLDEAGLTPKALIKARTDMIAGGTEAKDKYDALIAKIEKPSAAAGERARMTPAGEAMAQSASAQKSIRRQEDVGAFYKGVEDIYDTMKKQGMTQIEMLHSTAVAQHQIADDNDRQAELQIGVADKIQQNLQMQAPLMTRAQQFQSNIGQLGALEGITPNTPAQKAKLEQQKLTAAQGVVDQVSYVKQMLMMQDQFKISQERAQADYAEQQSYQLHDFNLQRNRAEQQFNLGRHRATADYYRSVSRANYQFNLQRNRQEQDYNHQTTVMAKQMAMTVYSIYDRVQVERTSSAEWLVANASDQMARMQQQEENLKRLRKMGVTDTTIQQLHLTDPKQAQEAANLVATLTKPLIRQLNEVAGKGRVEAAKDLQGDSSNLDSQERQRGYRRMRRQNLEDHNLSMKQSRNDFMRQLSQQKDDFNLMMKNQDTDFQTSVNRQEKAYKKSMSRSAEDLANASKEISGSIESILKRGSTELTGYAQDTADAALTTFTKLKTSTRPVAIAIMKDLSEIFGFDYKVPKLTANTVTPPETRGGGVRSTGGHTLNGMHQGGTVPGYNPGRDTHQINVGGGEAIMRPEWTRAVGGAKAVDAMNHRARYGGFAKGGVFWPLPGGSWSTYPGHDGIDLNSPNDMGKPFYAAAPGKISYTGWNHGYGDAIFESGPYGTLVYGHGSKVAVHAGQMVAAGQYLGNVGSTGHSTGPHLHVGFPGGTSSEILSFLHGSAHTGYGAANEAGLGVTRHALKAILKDRYPSAEKAAYGLQGEHPLFPGDISKVINRMAHSVIHRLRRNSVGADGPTSIGNEPNGSLSNEGIVHVGANRMGWADQWGDLRKIVMHESGFRNTAQNPTSSAYGMFQFLDGTWGSYGGKKTSDPWKQTEYGLRYIKDRYKDPHGAWNFWQDHNWYGNGAVFNGPQTIGVGENGPEAVIPLNDRGGEFLTKAMMGVDARRYGMGSSPAGGGLNVFNTRIDRSTNFTGAITVQANDPAELIHKLQARQRVMALSRPSLTGSAA